MRVLSFTIQLLHLLHTRVCHSPVHILSKSTECIVWATLQNNGTDLSLTAVCVAVGDESHVKMNTHNTIRATRK